MFYEKVQSIRASIVFPSPKAKWRSAYCWSKRLQHDRTKEQQTHRNQAVIASKLQVLIRTHCSHRLDPSFLETAKYVTSARQIKPVACRRELIDADYNSFLRRSQSSALRASLQVHSYLSKLLSALRPGMHLYLQLTEAISMGVSASSVTSAHGISPW